MLRGRCERKCGKVKLDLEFKSLMIMVQLMKTQVERLPSNPGRKGGFIYPVKLNQQFMDTTGLIPL